MAVKKRGLGRGLDALLGGTNVNTLEEQALHMGCRMQVRIRAEGFDGVLRMVARGAGLGIVPRATIERWQAPRTFEVVNLSEPWADRKLLLCARSFAQLPTYAMALLEALSL